MTFIEKTKRYFAPLKGQSLLVYLSIFKFATWALYALFGTYIVRKGVEFYSEDNLAGLKYLALEFTVWTVTYFIVAIMLRTVDWPRLWHQIQRWIEKTYIQKIIEMDGNALEKIGTGRMISVISSAEKIWIDGILHMIKEGTQLIVVALYATYIIFSESFIFGGIFILLFLGLHLAVGYLDNLARKHRKNRIEKQTELSREVVRIIMSRNDILQSGSIHKDIGKIEGIINGMEVANNGINKALFQIFNLVRIFSSGIRLFFIVALIVLHEKQIFSVPDVAGILSLIIVFEGFLFNSTEFYKNFTKDFVNVEKLWSIFDNAPKMRGYDSGLPFSPQEKNIEIQNITYGYNETKVFENFSLMLEKGKKTALVGASGGGKTTLMKLIAGYLHPESGSISVMGNALSDTALKTYYPHIGYLTQEPGVFDATIRENLVSAISNVSVSVMSTESPVSVATTRHLAGKNTRAGFLDSAIAPLEMTETSKTQKDALEQKLTRALRLAQCDFVFELEHGLDTEIGERGVRLSGGQKQRLAIAKIFLKDPEIILLDEPTSALDSFSEEKITEALNTLFEGRTVIIVAHRLQTVKRADDIIVIEGGEVVERGNHASLSESGGVYAKMLELQSGF